MNVYYQKYIKYKTKYLEIKYGGNGKGGKKSKSKAEAEALPSVPPIVSASSAPPVPPTVSASSASSAPSTPAQSIVLPASVASQTPHQTPGSISSVAPEPSTPKFKVNPGSIQALIEKKADLLCKLEKCLDDPKFKIRAKEQPKVQHQFYINIKKDNKAYAHFSFHYPDESKEVIDNFEVDALHLKLDINKDIVFNLVNYEGNYKLQSSMDDCVIRHYIGEEFETVKKIIACFESIFNTQEYRKIFEEPTARKLEF